jgi:hypothetical protein
VTCLCERGNEPSGLVKFDFLKQLHNVTLEVILSILQLVLVGAIVYLQELQKVLQI